MGSLLDDARNTGIVHPSVRGQREAVSGLSWSASV
jgi:hypothetical protein